VRNGPTPEQRRALAAAGLDPEGALASALGHPIVGPMLYGVGVTANHEVPEARAAYVWRTVVDTVAGDMDAPATDSERDPLPWRATERAVELRVANRLSWPKIEMADVGLSHRKLGYVRTALRHGDLSWDEELGGLTLGPETRNTTAGIVLPRR
jgi:hypothetical protein